MIKALVIDDEPAIRKLLERGLAGFGYDVATVTNGADALTDVARQEPDIVLLDLNLGSEPDGLQVCRELRLWTQLPIIMLTVRDEKWARLAALNAGADDYITKPFDLEEVEARMRAVLRRTAPNERAEANGQITVDALCIDLANRRVLLNGDAVHLTPKEYRLLRALASNAGKVMTFNALLDAVWQDERGHHETHNVRVYINTLRKKLHDDLSSRAQPRYIFNEPGIGYRFTDR